MPQSATENNPHFSRVAPTFYRKIDYGFRNTVFHAGGSRYSVERLSGIMEMIRNGILLNTEVHNPHGVQGKPDFVSFDHKLYSLGVNDTGQLGLYRITIDDVYHSKSEPSRKRLHNLKYIEKIADIPINALPGLTSSGGLTEDESTTVYTVADMYNFVKRFDKEFVSAPEVIPELLNADETPKKLFHQTHANITEFRTDSPEAGRYDSETPNGSFFKENDHDIGLRGNKQIPVFLSMRNPLHFANRSEANVWYQANVPGYKSLQNEMRLNLGSIDDEMQKIENEMFADETDENRHEVLDIEWAKRLEMMRETENGYRGRLRELLNRFFLNGNSKYDGIILDDDGHRYVNGVREDVKTYIIFDGSQVKHAEENIGTFDKGTSMIRYSRVAPTFYRKIEQEVSAYKGDKIGAASAVQYLRGCGMKEEEIKWSGIRTFLEGKKSVSKAELLEYLQGNRLEITETVLGVPTGENFNAYDYTWERNGDVINLDYWYDDDGNEYRSEDDFRAAEIKKAAGKGIDEDSISFDINETWMLAEDEDGNELLTASSPDVAELRESGYKLSGSTKWDEYKLPGGRRYREYVFRMPGSEYSNPAMEKHWDLPGVIAHARVQDFTLDNGDRVLFIEEIPSD